MALLLEHPDLTPWMDPRMRRNPGIQPLDPGGWLRRDGCFPDQMALRDRLLAERRDDVFATDADEGPSRELLAAILSATGAVATDDAFLRADGVAVPAGAHPLLVAARLVQEDLLILRRRDAGWVLTDGALCFPSHWTLREKMGRELDAIHAPVPFYAPDLAKRVRRLFDAMRPEQPLWRANWLIYPDADLHAPRREGEDKRADWSAGIFIRVERQSLVKLPRTGAVVFTIKTDICPLEGLTGPQVAGLIEAFDALPTEEQAHKGGAVARSHLVAALTSGALASRT